MKILPTVSFLAHPSFFLKRTGNHLLEKQMDSKTQQTGYSHLSLIRGMRPNKMQLLDALLNLPV